MQNTTLIERYHHLQNKLTTTAKAAEQKPPLLLAVSKGVKAEAISTLYYQGQRAFGESYWQEFASKKDQLKELHNLEWHFIGRLQSNKLANIAENFSWVHSVASLKHAQKLNLYRAQQQLPLNICLQVNFTNEASKAGFAVEELWRITPEILKLPYLKCRGLMLLPQMGDTESFYCLQKLLHQMNKQLGLKLDTLSMGMSHDYAEAIVAGSTIVRIGTELFADLKEN